MDGEAVQRLSLYSIFDFFFSRQRKARENRTNQIAASQFSTNHVVAKAKLDSIRFTPFREEDVLLLAPTNVCKSVILNPVLILINLWHPCP